MMISESCGCQPNDDDARGTISNLKMLEFRGREIFCRKDPLSFDHYGC